jgi:hypothetical protein
LHSNVTEDTQGLAGAGFGEKGPKGPPRPGSQSASQAANVSIFDGQPVVATANKRASAGNRRARRCRNDGISGFNPWPDARLTCLGYKIKIVAMVNNII